MSKYAGRASISINGQKVKGMRKFSIKALTRRKVVELMEETGVMDLEPRHAFSIDYAVPADRPPFDFNIEDATVVVFKEDGKKITFTGCYAIEEGEEAYDGENESIKPIDFMATGRTDE